MNEHVISMEFTHEIYFRLDVKWWLRKGKIVEIYWSFYGIFITTFNGNDALFPQNTE